MVAPPYLCVFFLTGGVLAYTRQSQPSRSEKEGGGHWPSTGW